MSKPDPIRRFLTEGRNLTLILLPVSLLLGGFFLYEWGGTRATTGTSLHHGEVIERRMAPIWFFVQRPRLTIRVDRTREIVHAVLSLNAMNDIPNRVSFYANGRPNAEVYLLEEDNPLWAALFFLCAPLATLAVLSSWLLPRGLSEAGSTSIQS